MRRLTLIFSIAAGILPGSAFSQSQPAESGMTAREMFLAARDKPVPKATPVPVRKPAPAHPAETASSKPSPKRPAPQPVSSNPELIRTAYTNTPLGLRYTIVKLESGRFVDVPTDTVFHNGDKIRIAVEVTEPGFLYIVTQGSSGTWEVLFPSPKIKNGNNRVEMNGRYEVPQGYNFTFSGKPGIEKLSIIFSRKAEPEIDNLIYSLQDKKPKSASEPQVLMAKLEPINDSVVSALRETYSRDLIIEPVNESAADSKQPGHQAEHAVYVVNPKGGEDSRVVADVSLNHQ